MGSKSEVVAAARKLVRTIPSAPDPRRQARLILAKLQGPHAWPALLQDKLDGFAAWLESHPPVGELHARSSDLVAQFQMQRFGDKHSQIR